MGRALLWTLILSSFLSAQSCKASDTSALSGENKKATPVTDAEKKEFLELLGKLPARCEFYTDEGVTRAGPYLRVLLALTEKDIDKYPFYPFAVLSRQLCDRKEHQVYAVNQFDKIAHPLLKLSWAVTLFNTRSASPEVVKYLRVALESKEQSRTLAQGLGPGFEDFKKRVQEYEVKQKK